MGNTAADDTNLLEQLRTEPSRALEVLYTRHKQMVTGYIRKLGGDNEDHVEAYHDAVLAFYQIWLEGRFDNTRASISTLLCAIGKNKLLTKLGKQQRHSELSDVTDIADRVDDEPSSVNEDLLGRVEKAIDILGEGCKEIIVLFYYQRCSMREIVERLQYKNENVVKAHKSRCMKRLKDLVESNDS